MKHLFLIAIVCASLLAGLSTVAIAESGSWKDETWQNPMTDEVWRIVGYSDDDGVEMSFKCSGSAEGVSATIFVKTGLADFSFGDYRTVRWRVNKEKPVEQRWANIKGGGSAVFGDEAWDMVILLTQKAYRFVFDGGNNIIVFGIPFSNEKGAVLPPPGLQMQVMMAECELDAHKAMTQE